MESLVMNYSDEEDVFPPEGRIESNHFTSRPPNPVDNALQEIMEIPDSPKKILGTFGFPFVRSPGDLKDAAINTDERIKSRRNQIEHHDDNIVVISDEDDSNCDVNDVISSIIISRVETVVDEQDYVVLCKSFDNIEYHNGSHVSSVECEETDKENSTAATFLISSSSSVDQETDTATAIGSENFNVFPIGHKEYVETDKGNSFGVTSTIPSTPLVGHEAETETTSENPSVSAISGAKEDEVSAKSTAVTLPISTRSLVDHGVNSDNGGKEYEIIDKNNSVAVKAVSSPLAPSPSIRHGARSETATDSGNADTEDEKSDIENPTAVTSRIFSTSLVGHGADTEAAMDSDCSEYHSVSPVSSDEEIEKSDKEKSTAATLPISSNSLVGQEADLERSTDLDKCENHSVLSPKSERGQKENSSARAESSLGEPSESQGERSNQFEANSRDTSSDSQKSQGKPSVIYDRTTFKCKLCSYSSTTRFGLKRHVLTHSEYSDLNKIKCAHCPFETKSKKSLYDHWLVTHKRSKCTNCDTFVTAHLKKYHLLKCKAKKNIFECQECPYKTIYGKMFVRHRIECTNKRRFIPRKSEAFGDKDGILEKSKQPGEINEPSKQLYCCEYCSYSTEHVSHFKAHIPAHTVSNRPIYRCPECDYKSTRQSLSHHMKTHKIKFKNASLSAEAQQLSSRLSCNFCSYTATKNGQLMNHLPLHTVRKKPIVSCIKCDYKAPRITLFYHYRNVHGLRLDKEDKTKQVYTCKFCSHTTNNEDCLEKHLLLHTVHNRPIYRCPKCDYKSTKRNLGKHVKTVHKIQSIHINSFKKTYIGTQTVALSNKNTRGATSEDVQKRLKQSNNKKLDTNENEEQTLERPQKLLSRTKTRQQLLEYPEFSCELCSFTSKFEANFNRHLRIHTVQNKQCNKSTDVNMTRHSHIQRREQRISKQSNSKDLNTSGEETLRRSQKLLSMIKTREQLEQPQYICDFCSFGTKFEPSLIRHLRLHTERNERIYSCTQCNYKSTKKSLAQHSRIHRIDQTIIAPVRKSPRRALPEDAQKTVPNSRRLSNEIDTSDNEGGEFVEQSEQFLSTTRTNEKLSDLEYGCDLCSFTTNFEQNLDKHLNLHEVGNEQTYSGSQCEYKSTKLQLQNVTTHSRIVHGEKLVSGQQKGETKVKTYRCHLCSFTTKVAEAFERHDHLHEMNRAAVETKMPLLSKRRKSEDWEKPAETANKQLIGDKLPKIIGSSVTSESFQMADGNNNILYVCEICDYTTNHKQNLICHKLAHLSTKTFKAKSPAPPTSVPSIKKVNCFKCSTCKRCFSTNMGYRLHVCEQDTDEYTVCAKGESVIYKCRRCSYQTITKQNMKRHCRENVSHLNQIIKQK